MKAATAQAPRPDTIEDWLILVPHLLSPEGWQTLVQKPSSTLQQSSSPWGDILIKYVLEDVVVLHPPEDPAHLLVRPETRAWSCECEPDAANLEEIRQVREMLACFETYWTDWPWIRLCDTLFGILYSQHPVGNLCFGHTALPVTTIERVRRNFPEKGDCSLTWSDQSNPFVCTLLCRLQKPGHYTMHFIMGTLEGFQMPVWASNALRLVLDAFRCQAICYLNRPQLILERERDRTLYMVLNMTSFGSRPPLIPALGTETGDMGQLTNIEAGKELGLSKWVSYDPAMMGNDAFRLSEYLRLFFRRVGVHVHTYQSLDGQELLPYQCVVQREEWYVARDHFKATFALQKTAYRRANGGTSTPRLVEESTPRFCREVVASCQNQTGLASDVCELVVHKTFFELPDDVRLGMGFADRRRCRSVSPVR
ncbi:unnamed protein product [Symbiodinium sp. CCMP2592]|nr:unnamed protein product [Symbiodinium sp. CCMP2592]